ncbi:non-ribosomal peptide synthetase family protein [Streptacidiphilus rugosus]|uniref:non-ribosomal peptide synthetase family protein n=1 Tax=Streptacidiphilus rugosus TaxID=405783 RepID=UPI000A02111D|nr:amino acid adenylation domain-containing protein [Streptacidiphilus rugosus]
MNSTSALTYGTNGTIASDRSGAAVADVCLSDLLARQAAERPDATAVAFRSERLSYRRLHELSRELGAGLAGLGVRPDDCVGLFTEPSPDLMVGAWGILAAGAAYLPLSPDYPEDRLRYMIEDSGTTVVVTQPHLRDRLLSLAPPGTRIVTPEDELHGPSAAVPVEPRAENLAYVIYTSGSTGKPKGVMIEHRSIVSQLRWLGSCGHLGPQVTVLQKTPMSFDAAQWEILAPAAGARVVMGEPGIYRDPQALVETVRAYEVTTLQCVPTLLQALLDTEGFADCGSLRRVFSGGEALTHSLARDFFREMPGVSLVNLYGPTETTINATAHQVDPEDLADTVGDSCTVPIGVPVDDVSAYVLDESLAPVDIGEPGELYLGGVQVARGYLGRPEQTAERFVAAPFGPDQRLYRTGDVCLWNPDGTLQFAGRTDNQVKLRGYRVELEEVSARIEEHTWVRRAAAIVTDDARTGHQALVACVELNPKTAAVMDQGSHGGHHQSKASKLQVKAQLSNPGLREPEELAGRQVTALPGRTETPEQRRETFARKTYRFYEGGRVSREDLLALLAPRAGSAYARRPDQLTFAELGEILRWFGQFHSPERLLPKYSYASPGALYATQLYLESGGGVAGLRAGVHYYHPVDHTLVRVGEPTGQCRDGGLLVHFLGKRRAIEPVYRNNILEVLEFEAGHMLGVLEEVLPGHGLTVTPVGLLEPVQAALDVAAEDHYLGTFEITANDGRPRPDHTELFVQAHGDLVGDLPGGQYRYRDGRLEPLGTEVIEARHVIAINQGVYARAGFGISAVSRAPEPWLEYISLGARLHQLQRTPGFGFMPSGYSSKTGHPLPAARRLDDILGAHGIPTGASYFFLGGRVSDEQVAGEGMYEDSVHTKGPAEMIRDELAQFLPDFMLPNRVLVLDALPLTANGKIDAKALAKAPEVCAAQQTGPYEPPSTPTEKWLAEAWGAALRYEDVSALDEFFSCGGNSLISVALVNRVNREYGIRLPLQVIFEAPRLRELAARIDDAAAGGADTGSRLIPLAREGSRSPVFCWPGLGGYPMNLRLLGSGTGALDRPFFGVQAFGINTGETPYPTIREMAAADLGEIRGVQPAGPYTLWGYSFGARVAFEAAWQLEQAGEKVDRLFLICPGNPQLGRPGGQDAAAPAPNGRAREASWANPAYVTILFSVFAGTIEGPELAACLAATRDEAGFVAFVHDLFPSLDRETILRITRIVGTTYEFDYSFHELKERTIEAPITIFKARGDDYSFIERHSGYSTRLPTVVELEGDHYSVLKEHGVAELLAAVHAATD